MDRHTRIVTLENNSQILELIEASRSTRTAPVLDELMAMLQTARLVPQHKIEMNVVTMNSSVLLRQQSTKKLLEVVLTYPKDADPANKRVSIFSTIGVAILGIRTGWVTRWKTPIGWDHFRVEEVIFQPEAAKQYQH